MKPALHSITFFLIFFTVSWVLSSLSLCIGRWCKYSRHATDLNECRHSGNLLQSYHSILYCLACTLNIKLAFITTNFVLLIHCIHSYCYHSHSFVVFVKHFSYQFLPGKCAIQMRHYNYGFTRTFRSISFHQ